MRAVGGVHPRDELEDTIRLIFNGLPSTEVCELRDQVRQLIAAGDRLMHAATEDTEALVLAMHEWCRVATECRL